MLKFSNGITAYTEGGNLVVKSYGNNGSSLPQLAGGSGWVVVPNV